MNSQKSILFIHQSSELYGSDKTLLFLVKELQKENFLPLVVLPNDGPLKQLLEKESIKVFIAPVLKISRKMFSLKNLCSLPLEIRKGYKILDEIKKQYDVSIIYSNTLAVLIGYFYARKRKLKHIWHVHEIIESPKKVTQFFRYILASKNTTTILYNSNATASFWNQTNQVLIEKTNIIWNGLERPKEKASDNNELDIRKELFNSTNSEIIIGLVGRISRWKGQQLLLDAFLQLSKNHQNIKLVFIGSTPPNQEVFQETLEIKIKEYKLENKVLILPFQENIWKIWDAIDIAVIPSTEPEPFGLVAIEAMLAKKPVVAANHGGLKEIIVQNETGILFEPRNQDALSNALETLILDENKRLSFGNKGFDRAQKEFSLNNYVSKISKILSQE